MTYLYRVLFSSFLLFPLTLIASDFADKDFYLVDSLVLDELSLDDQKLLDSCLTFYHNTDNDTDRIKSIDRICENMVNESWKKYQTIHLSLIKKTLKQSRSLPKLITLKRFLANNITQLGHIYSDKGNMSKSKSFYYKSLKMREEIGDKEGVASSLVNIGLIYSYLRSYDQAMSYYRKGYTLFKELANKKEMTITLHNMANVYSDWGDFANTILYHYKSLRISWEIGNERGVSGSLNDIGCFYSEQGNIPKALKYLNTSLTIRKKTQDHYRIAETLNNIGIIYFIQEDNSEALKYYYQCLRIMKRIGNKLGVARSLINIASIYRRMGDLKKSLLFYKKSSKLFEEIGVKDHSTILLGIGAILNDQYEYEEALTLFKRCLIRSKLNGDKISMARTLNNIGTTYLNMRKFKQALGYAKQGFEIAEGTNNAEVIGELALTLSIICENLDDHERALDMHKLFVQMKDSIDYSGFMRELTKQENKFTLEKKSNELQLLSKERRLEKQRFTIYMILLGLCIIFLSAVFYVIHRKKKMQYEEELNKLRTLKIEAAEEKSVEKKKSILIKRGRKLSSIELKDVVYFRADNNYVLLIDKTGVSYVVDYTLSKLEEQLPENFIRVHRSSIINAENIELITKGYRGKYFFTMKDKSGTKIDSSNAYAENVKSLIDEFEEKSI